MDVCDKKNEDVPEDQSKNFTLKELSEIFHDIESLKDKMLEADPNLERNMTVHQAVEKMLAL